MGVLKAKLPGVENKVNEYLEDMFNKAAILLSFQTNSQHTSMSLSNFMVLRFH